MTKLIGLFPHTENPSCRSHPWRRATCPGQAHTRVEVTTSRQRPATSLPPTLLPVAVSATTLNSGRELDHHFAIDGQAACDPNGIAG